MSEKKDSFQARRATNIDGFFTPGGQQPRQPAFRGESKPGISSAPPQQRIVGFSDMPRQHSIPQTGYVNPDIISIPPAQPTADKAQRSISVPSAPPKEPKKSRHQIRKERKRAKKAGKKPSRGKRIAKVFGIILLISILAFGARFYKDIARLTGNYNPFSILSVFKPAHLANDNGRVNILVAGNSADDSGHDGAQLTDSIMVLSLNTKNDTALMLSIPRDTYVSIPGYGHAKINEAYPDGGMDLLKTVVQDTTGLPIHYTALVNYTAFKDLVNAVGGITINIDSSDPRGIYDPSLDYTSRHCCALAKYPNGQVTLNGKQALNLARARGDAYGSYGFPDADYTRTEHQRQMLVAIKDKASSTSVVANPLKVGSLVDALGSSVRTDLQLNEMQALYYYSKKVDDTKIDSYNIRDLKGSSELMLVGDTINGQSVQVPAAGLGDFSDIQAQIKHIFSASPVEKENAAIVILNATDSAGLAYEQAVKLDEKGAAILGHYDASTNKPNSTIINNSAGKKPNTLAYLQKTYSATVAKDPTLTAKYPLADFILILGANAVPKTTAPSQ
jgi:LCP family protein required for cell wall assembly